MSWAARFPLGGAVALLLGVSVTWADGSAAARPAFSETAYRAHIEQLSSDEFEGRAPGTEGEKKTLAYMCLPTCGRAVAIPCRTSFASAASSRS